MKGRAECCLLNWESKKRGDDREKRPSEKNKERKGERENRRFSKDCVE